MDFLCWSLKHFLNSEGHHADYFIVQVSWLSQPGDYISGEATLSFQFTETCKLPILVNLPPSV